jgi:hypothetical protein
MQPRLEGYTRRTLAFSDLPAPQPHDCDHPMPQPTAAPRFRKIKVRLLAGIASSANASSPRLSA